MGLTFEQIENLTFEQYEKLVIAQLYKEQKEEAKIRRIVWAVINYGGMGTKDFVDESKIYPLPLVDNLEKEFIVNSAKRARLVTDRILKGIA